MTQRVARSRDLVAEGHSPSVVARVAQISRQAIYRTARPRRSPQRQPVTDPVDVAIVETARSYPTDGYRMVCCFVRRQLGVAVNRKRVLRVMREQKLIQRRPVEARRRRPGVFKVERPGQLWHLDMTSVWVAEHGWTYLNAIIDCCTREIVGWSLELRCRAAEATAVIKQAVDEQRILPGTLTLGTDNGSEQLLPSDLIVPCGFVRLPEPINILPAVAEEADEFMAFGHSAFSWMTSSDGIFLSYWHSRDDLRTEVPDIPASAPSLYAGRFCGWPFEMDYWLDSVYLYPRVFFRLVMQRLAQIERVRPDRATRRRIERDGGTVANLNIVRLRRPTGAGAGTGEGSREYTHQWMVGGHWRQQWYASIQSHRQIWISPYVKGPEGTELIIKSRIFDVAV